MYNFVTSFHKQHEEVYGLKMLDSVVKKWKPTDFKLYVYLEGYDGKSDGLPQADFIEYRHLENIQARTDFITRNSDKNGRFGEAPYNYRMDAVRFCHKVYAMSDLFFELLEQESRDWMVWLDADTLTKKMFKAEDAAKILIPEVDIVHLGRIDIDYSETGFIGFNLGMHNACSLLVDLRGAYDTDEVFAYREWTDAFVFTRLLKIYEAHGMKARNLSEGVRGLSVFDQCMLDEHFTHNKGNLKLNNETSKDLPASNAKSPKRYKKLAALVRHYSEGLSSFSIVETGTWNGGRAIEMALTAFEAVGEVHYRGFDLFEQATNETDALELNVKQHNALAAVTKRLEEFQEKCKEQNKTFTFKLHAGDTKETMKDSRYDDVDFVFIDGGHSLDTVASDYSFVKDCPVVVFDDYYSTQDNKELPEEHTGINQTFAAIEDRKKNILPSDDPTAFGGIVHLAVCVKKEYKNVPAELLRVPIIVKPKDSMPSKHIKKSVTQNIAKIDEWDWVKQYKTTDDHVMIVSGGKIDFDKVRETQKKYNAKIWCVKHSYPRLLEEGIVPDACMILDPRSIDGISTHGVKR
jgi:glutamine cyclotransferase